MSELSTIEIPQSQAGVLHQTVTNNQLGLPSVGVARSAASPGFWTSYHPLTLNGLAERSDNGRLDRSSQKRHVNPPSVSTKSSFLLLVVRMLLVLMPGATSSVLAPSSGCPLLLVVLPMIASPEIPNFCCRPWQWGDAGPWGFLPT